MARAGPARAARERVGVGGDGERVGDGIGAGERDGVEAPGAGGVDQPHRRGGGVGQVPAVDRDVDDVGAEGADAVGQHRIAAVALHHDPAPGDVERGHVAQHLGAGLVARLPVDLEAGADGGAARLRAAGQHGRRSARLAQASVEPGALGRREPRPGADAGGEDDELGWRFEGLLGRPQGGVAVVQERGVHHRAVDHLRAATARQHLGLFLPPAVAGDADGVSRERTNHADSMADQGFGGVSGPAPPREPPGAASVDVRQRPAARSSRGVHVRGPHPIASGDGGAASPRRECGALGRRRRLGAAEQHARALAGGLVVLAHDDAALDRGARSRVARWIRRRPPAGRS